MRALILFSALAMFAQQPAVFRTSTKLVVVNVTVRDKSGKVIDNLGKEDFTLLEDGKPQAISVFELEHLSSDVLPPAPAPGLKIRTATPVPADNRPATPATTSRKDRRLLALFFDLSSMQPPEQIRAKDAALKFLREQMTSSDLVSILTFSNRLNVVEEFTDDRERLIADIERFRVGESSELAVDAPTGADETDDSGEFTPDDTEFNIFNTDRKLSALESAAKQLGMYPEKKALIYFSSGVSKTGVDNQSQLQSTVNAAVRANVAFYPIDARGLMATPPGGDASTASPKGTGIFTGKSQRGIRAKINDQQETLYTLAADTGGKAMLDNNDLSVGITQAQKDINSYYILGYYSTNTAEDGKYRRIRVRVNSQPLAKLDYRPGYYASKLFKNFSASDKEQQLQEALTLGDPVTDLPMALEVDYFRLARDKYFVPISVKIPGSSLSLSAKDKTDFDFIGQIRDKGGKLIGGVRDGIQVKLTEADASKLGRKQLEYDTGVTLPPGDYILRFLARENQSGKMGTFETAFTVPDLSKDSTTVRVSSVVWSNQRELVSSSVGSAGTSSKLLAMHPLVQDGQKLVPSITRVFRKDQRLYVYFEVYDPATGQQPPSVAAELTLFRAKSKVFESEPVRLTQVSTNRSNTMAFRFQLPLSNMQPGQYTCQVNVIDEQARKFAFVRSPMVVVP
jgi:VWFA-related protein